MENEKNICPECGTESAHIESSQKILRAPFGSTEIFEEEVFECKGCGYEFDDDADGLRYEATYQVSAASSIPAILQLLDEKGYSMVATERILELPFRTLSRWKSELKISAAGQALLRMLATFPWLLEVADNDYEKQFAENVLLHEATKALSEKLNQNNICYSGGVVPSVDKTSVTIVANLHRNQPNASLSPGNNFVFETHGEPSAVGAV